MKTRFKYIFLVASWVIYFATGRGIIGSIFLILSSLYMLCDAIAEWRHNE